MRAWKLEDGRDQIRTLHAAAQSAAARATHLRVGMRACVKTWRASNNAVERTAGSPALAAAAHCARSTDAEEDDEE